MYYLLLVITVLSIVYLIVRKKSVDEIFSLADAGKVEFFGRWPEPLPDIKPEDYHRIVRAREVIFPFSIGRTKALGVQLYLSKSETIVLDGLVRRIPGMVSNNTYLSDSEKLDVLEGHKALHRLLNK